MANRDATQAIGRSRARIDAGLVWAGGDLSAA